MKYVNGFQINATGNECFITLVVTRPDGKGEKITEEVETIIMNEGVARQLSDAMKELYKKIDSDRSSKRQPDIVKNSGTKLS